MQQIQAIWTVKSVERGGEFNAFHWNTYSNSENEKINAGVLFTSTKGLLVWQIQGLSIGMWNKGILHSGNKRQREGTNERRAKTNTCTTFSKLIKDGSTKCLNDQGSCLNMLFTSPLYKGHYYRQIIGYHGLHHLTRISWHKDDKYDPRWKDPKVKYDNNNEDQVSAKGQHFAWNSPTSTWFYRDTGWEKNSTISTLVTRHLFNLI